MHRILLDDYRDIILRSGSAAIASDDVVIGTDGKFSLRYIPFEHVAREAKLVIVGITPGNTQLIAAYDAFRARAMAGRSDDEARARAKEAGAFAGSMRTNLVRMLEHFDIHRRLGIASAADLWGKAAALLHSTSVVPHAAFENGKMFNGTFSAVLASPLLRDSFEQDFIPSLEVLPVDAHFIALGPTPLDALEHCADIGLIGRDRILGMLPHPSGSSGSQVPYFLKEVSVEEMHEKNPIRNRAARLDAAYTRMSETVSRLDGSPFREVAEPPPPPPPPPPPTAVATPRPMSLPKREASPVVPASPPAVAPRGRAGIHSIVSRGKDAGLVLHPHLYPDGSYVVSRSRFEDDYVKVGSLPEIASWLAKGYSLRMSNQSEAPRRGPVLIAPGSIRGL
jgi:hypothetical protein